MANDLNLWQGIGRLGKDPEIRHMNNGYSVASFSIACGSKWKDKKSGEMQEKVEWVNLTAFGKLAEIIGKYLVKGSQVYVSGRMQTDKFQDKTTGADRYSTKVIVDRMQMLGSKQENDQGGQNQRSQHQGGSSQGGSVHQQPSSRAQSQNYDDFDDDIPF